MAPVVTIALRAGLLDEGCARTVKHHTLGFAGSLQAAQRGRARLDMETRLGGFLHCYPKAK
jgi:hypothetical protein